MAQDGRPTSGGVGSVGVRSPREVARMVSSDNCGRRFRSDRQRPFVAMLLRRRPEPSHVSAKLLIDAQLISSSSRAASAARMR